MDQPLQLRAKHYALCAWQRFGSMHSHLHMHSSLHMLIKCCANSDYLATGE